MSYNNGKNLHISGNNFKSLGFFVKGSHHFKKASIKSAFKKPQFSTSLEMPLNNRNLYKILNFSENIFKMQRILKNKNASHPQKKSLVAIAALP
jgi:hypothetical protein